MESYQDDIGHWDKKATLTLTFDFFWWPLMYENVCNYVKTCQDCQRMSFVSKYSSGLKASLTRLFDRFSMELSGPVPLITREMRFLLICAKHLTDWRLACLTSSATASEVISIIQQHINYSFGRPRLIVLETGLCLTARLLDKFRNKYSVDCKTMMEYAVRWNGRADRMARTIKGATGKMMHHKPLDCDRTVLRVLYGYRRRAVVSGFSPFQLLYGVSSRMFFEHLLQYEADRSASERRLAEVLALASYRAT